MSARDLLQRGREAFEARDWNAAVEAFEAAGWHEKLRQTDMERLAFAAHLSGRRARYLEVLEALYHDHVALERHRDAARAAFWLGFEFGSHGEGAQASAWFTRAQQCVEQEPDDCVEQGYLALPEIQRHLAANRWDEAQRTAEATLDLAERFDDFDLQVFARHALGVILLRRGEVQKGVGLLDEVLLSITTREVFPVLAGVVYCSAISAWRRIMDIRRMREWTKRLSDWCSRQSGLVIFLGECRVFRSELHLLTGNWADALDEAQQALEMGRSGNPTVLGGAWYQLGELRRLRGDDSGAEEAYREAHLHGHDPQPGLAELWIRQGQAESAVHALRRALSEAADDRKRLRLLPALVLALLDVGGVESARRSCDELTASARAFAPSDDEQPSLAEAVALECSGRTALALDRPDMALPALRGACTSFQKLGMPYRTARVRVALAFACRQLGDQETAQMELAAARSVFERLSIDGEVERLDAHLRRSGRPSQDLLTSRERQILSLLSTGRTNREIAQHLDRSVRTVDRHVSNIFDKLGVSSRAAAAVRAVELGLADRHD